MLKLQNIWFNEWVCTTSLVHILRKGGLRRGKVRVFFFLLFSLKGDRGKRGGGDYLHADINRSFQNSCLVGWAVFSWRRCFVWGSVLHWGGGDWGGMPFHVSSSYLYISLVWFGWALTETDKWWCSVSSFSHLRFINLNELLAADLPLLPTEFESLVKKQCWEAHEHLRKRYSWKCGHCTQLIPTVMVLTTQTGIACHCTQCIPSSMGVDQCHLEWHSFVYIWRN